MLTPLLVSSGISSLLMIAVMFALLYFVMIRPGMKRAKAQQAEREEMINALAPGSRVMLTSGMFGTIRHMGERQAVVELAPGVEITVMKTAINKVVAPEDEDFEYEDEVVDADGTPVASETVVVEEGPVDPTSADRPGEPTNLDDLPAPSASGEQRPDGRA